MQESQTAQSNTGLIYGLNDRPPVREAIFAAIQHLLAIFVAIITPPLIIAGALKLDLETTSFLVSMSLFCLRYFYLYPMQTDRRHRHRSLMYPRNQFFIYRSHHLGRYAGRTSTDFRHLHRGIICRDGHQPHLKIYP